MLTAHCFFTALHKELLIRQWHIGLLIIRINVKSLSPGSFEERERYI